MSRTAAATAAAANAADTAEYKAFIEGVTIGDTVSVYNLATGATYSTQVIAINSKYITTQVPSALPMPAQRFTAKRGSGTANTGTEGLKLVPYLKPKLVRYNPKRTFKAPHRLKINSVEAVEANVGTLLAKANG